MRADEKDVGKPERRAQIAAAAKQVFAERGYFAASVSDIIERARIARGTFYLYFDGKAAVFDAVLDDAMSALRGMVRRIDVTPGAPPAAAQLRRQLVACLEYILSDRPLAIVLLESAANHGDAALRLEQFFADVRALITRALSVGQTIGVVRPMAGFEADRAAAALLGMVRGVVQFSHAQGVTDVATVVDDLIRLALQGLARQAQ